MRVLVVGSPMVGHVLPLVPLARAFGEEGQDVVLATAGEGVDAARRAGLPARDVAPGLSMQRIGLGALLRHPVHIGRLACGGQGTHDSAGALFAPVNTRMADGVLALAEEWRADLVLHEALMPLGALAGARRGVPAVLVDALVYDGGALFTAVARRLGPLARRHGLRSVPGPDDVVTTIPPSLAGARPGHPMRAVAPAIPGDAPPDLALSGARPTVLVTRSTAGDRRRDRLMSTVVEAAEGADLDVVLVRPDRWVTRRPLPASVRATGWLPFADVLPHVAAVVHHGGSGTVLAALAAGVPQLVVRGPGDRSLHARLLRERGAGLGVPLDRLGRATLERLVGDPALRSGAQEVAAEIAAMPHPRELVGPLIELTGRPAAG
ncbi:glycosyltransferase [Geodermatophilus sp. YIM 151500]|uniref:glycosyltransferase n=1 Tax=Geodermatophilus sp. YIM 151500 TaxID=2984531 RepID=UPI0021E470CF|nr:glycosyltransferase [Geodermatophilus sp. YIM 151500]MCV2491827.1 glycosyltransferase [Geodermatophilus sp. YIM 151500]